MSAKYLIGVDVGGTFTDLICLNMQSGEMMQAKVPSFPGQQWKGVLDALRDLSIPYEDVTQFVHGTTIATNALLERRGARTGLITTEGFRDVLEVGRTRRLVGGLFDLHFKRAPALVERRLRLEVGERTYADGTRIPAPEADIEAAIETLRREGIEAVAVAFLNSYLDASNEEAVGARVREALGVPVSVSSDVVRERGEVGRFSTCVLNAYLSTVINAYLDSLTGELASQGLHAPINIMSSNGGAMSLETARGHAARTFLSGPVGGATGAMQLMSLSGVDDFITFDMGGTSTDVALFHKQMPRLSYENQIDAYLLQTPQLDIHTIGAGGGSIAWLQSDGTLEVGPRSAGALPGPACYGRGGTQPTISDANVVLGRLPADNPLSGGLKLSRDAAVTAMATLAEGKDIPVEAVADGVLRIAVAKMAGAVREVSVHRGFDPRDFVLVGFGGAGPMHICLVAEELGAERVMVPMFPGHLSALGQIMSDQRHDLGRSWGGRTDQVSFAELRTQLDELREEAREMLRRDGAPEDRMNFQFSLDMRYVGQSFTLNVDVFPEDGDFGPAIERFGQRHTETYGYADAHSATELVNIRCIALGVTDNPRIAVTKSGGERIAGHTEAWFNGKPARVPVYDRQALDIGEVIDGPAIIVEPGGTSVIPPSWRVTVDPVGNLDIRYQVAVSAPKALAEPVA